MSLSVTNWRSYGTCHAESKDYSALRHFRNRNLTSENPHISTKQLRHLTVVSPSPIDQIWTDFEEKKVPTEGTFFWLELKQKKKLF